MFFANFTELFDARRVGCVGRMTRQALSQKTHEIESKLCLGSRFLSEEKCVIFPCLIACCDVLESIVIAASGGVSSGFLIKHSCQSSNKVYMK